MSSAASPGPALAAIAPALSQDRLTELARLLGVALPASGTLAARGARLEAAVGGVDAVLRLLTRDELRAACRELGLDDSGRSRAELVARLRGGVALEGEAAPVRDAAAIAAGLPSVGDMVRVRSRRWIVDAVAAPAAPAGHHRVTLTCLDDDAPGRALEVVWERELGAAVVEPERGALQPRDTLDDPALFGAWLYALRWHCVTATDARLLQAPFRAGIKLLNHQIAPLERALRLPRANLFVADDVGLGKTIEAGLVLQELTLRQRVDLCLVVCPPAVTRQWRDEMRDRFGLFFEIVDRAFVARRRQERGFGVNPFTTHTRFIVSFALLRRPEYQEPLLAALGDRARRSLLILDEAHNAAPASGGLWTRDSETTRVIRHVAPRFENRLFLSATPHNGHSNSFSALLEMLDPQRFTRGVPVEPGPELDAVLVRRLKSDLAGAQASGFPERIVRRIALRVEGCEAFAQLSDDRATARAQHGLQAGGAGDVPAMPTGQLALGPVDALAGRGADELALSELLERFATAMLAEPGQGGARTQLQFVLIGLQKRLLSSVDAFWRTLRVVRDGSLRRELAQRAAPQLSLDDEVIDEEGMNEGDEIAVARHSANIDPRPDARALLDQMAALAERARNRPDLRFEALAAWIRQMQCPGFGRPDAPRADRAWGERRVIIFTEYVDTLRWLKRHLEARCEHTDHGELRVAVFDGSMGDDKRAAVQEAFNGPPDRYPVRILLCTDAAREGVNLQGWCADLFHFDIPWNPARLEQRNGRIDRALQRESTVRCHYFVYEQRPVDRVLEAVLQKTERIRNELGSLGAVLVEQLERQLEAGPSNVSVAQIEALGVPTERSATAERELEAVRNRDQIRRELNAAGRLLEASRRTIDFDEQIFRRVVTIGTALAANLPPEHSDAPQWSLPPMPRGWTRTLDLLRPPRQPDEEFAAWRRRPPRPCVFEAPNEMTSDVVHLHLQHPFVQRVLDRFRAQGTAAHDLSRVTAVVDASRSVPWVIAFARLSLFGRGAARLHEQIVSVAAPFGDDERLEPVDEATERELIRTFDRLFAAATPPQAVPRAVAQRLAAQAPRDLAALWPAARDEATALAADARIKLATRASEEAAQLAHLLERQRDRLDQELGRQLSFAFGPADVDERKQFEADRRHMERRRRQIDDELATEPAAIRAVYDVQVERIEPLGVLYLWPRSLT